MLWRRLNGLTLIGLLVSILGVWFAYDGSFITKGGMMPILEPSHDGWEEVGERRGTASERRSEAYAMGAVVFITGAILAYHGVKSARETKSDYPDQFGPWIVDKFHRIVAGVIFVTPAALIQPTAIPLWASIVKELPGILQAAAFPIWFVVIGLPFGIGGFLASCYWQRFASDNSKADSG